MFIRPWSATAEWTFRRWPRELWELHRMPFRRWPELKLRWWTQTLPRLYRIHVSTPSLGVGTPLRKIQDPPVFWMFVAWNSSGIFALTGSGDAKTSAHKHLRPCSYLLTNLAPPPPPKPPRLFPSLSVRNPGSPVGLSNLLTIFGQLSCYFKLAEIGQHLTM